MARAKLGCVAGVLVVCMVLSLYCLYGCMAAEPRMVFAHFMLYSYLYSDDVAGFTKEIQLAQSYGVDAFALNTPTWSDTLQARADNLYEAAATLNFKLFFSADFNSYDGTLTIDNIRTMLTRYAGHAAQLTYNNSKQFLSTFQGSAFTASPYTDALSTWRDGVINYVGGNVSFVPCFLVSSGSSTDIQNTITQFDSILSGLQAWDVSGWPYVDGSLSSTADRAYLQALGNAGKVYMAAMSPWFFNTGENGVRGNYAGDGLWRGHWESLIALQPPLVEILTWNDWAERTYVVSVSTDINIPPGAKENNDLGFPHLAYLDLAGRYYIPWYKTAQQPTIDSASKEALYIFYYTRTKEGSSEASTSVLEDRVYVTALLSEVADVVVVSGAQNQTFSGLQAGLQNVSMAFSSGQQSAQVLRNGVVVLSVTGALPINASSSASEDFNVYSAFQLPTS